MRDTLFGSDPEAHALVTGADGGAIQPGEVSTNPDLADILELLAVQGPSLFTTGAVGRVLVDDMAANGGLITRADLQAYSRSCGHRPCGRWARGPSPSTRPRRSAGPMLAVMLGELAHRDHRSWADVLDIQRRVLSYRLTVHDQSRDLERDGHALLDAVERYGLVGLPTSASTAHISAVDEHGTACAITMSSGYGAGMVIPGTGILLNNALGEPELNRLGLHAVASGTRLASNMAPTTARGAAGSALAVGSPGADRITTALLQVLGHTMLGGDTLQMAIDEPRAHVRFMPDGTPRVDHEPSETISEGIAQLGLASHAYHGPHMYFGGVGAAELGPEGLIAAGDARREAAVGVSP